MCDGGAPEEAFDFEDAFEVAEAAEDLDRCVELPPVDMVRYTVFKPLSVGGRTVDHGHKPGRRSLGRSRFQEG